MSDSKYKEIILAALTNSISEEKILELLGNDEYKIKEYNGLILEILRFQDTSEPKSIKLAAYAGDEAVECLQNEPDAENIVDSGEKSKINEFLKKFYEIENCPSFLYHKSVLEKCDYRLLLEIYSEFFGLTYEGENEACVEYLDRSFKSYAQNVIQHCRDISDEESLKILLG